ncbi:MAG: transglycosylase domain-containing protein, partial [Sulfurovaceae bacterium]|nr:transglycosylase domain-containing protein [Sulfurovaceae bacterium]
MNDVVWNIKLKTSSMVQELKWHFGLKRRSMQGYMELTILFPKVLGVYMLALMVDFGKTLVFFKNIIRQKIILIPFFIMVSLLSYYLFLIAGKPEDAKFDKKFLPQYYYNSAIEIRDQENRLAGSLTQPNSSTINPSLFIPELPPIFWTLLKESHDPHLDFENNASTFFEALFQNPRYYNGIDILEPLVQSKDLIKNMFTEQSFTIYSNPTLTQDLVSSFMNRYRDEPLNNIEKLKLAKTFYHKLKPNNGINFKRWVSTEHSFFFFENRGYGLRDTAEIFFGKSLRELTEAQQVILVAMYEKPYHLDTSIQIQEQEWDEIKSRAIALIKDSDTTKNSYILTSQIEKISQPNLPYFPDELMEVIGKITSKNRELISTLPLRSRELLKSTKDVITQELDRVYKMFGISPQSKLVTKIELNFPIANNLYFNNYLTEETDALDIDKLWVSVVNEEGEFIRLYQKNLGYQNPPQIGNLAKLFTAMLFVDRGDKYYSSYCNKAHEGIIDPTGARGVTKCNSNSWIDARRVFASEAMLPLYDGFVRYKQRDKRGEKIYYEPIYTKKIELLYRNLWLQTLQDNEPREDFGLGKLQMTPLDFQVSLHKITQMLYRPNSQFYDAKLIKRLSFYNIENSNIAKEPAHLSFHSPA